MTNQSTPSAKCKGCIYGCKDCMANANAQTPSAPSPDEGGMEKLWEKTLERASKDCNGPMFTMTKAELCSFQGEIESLQSSLKQAEAELESSSKKARELLELANDGHFGTKNRVHLIQSLSPLSNQYTSSK